MKEHFASFPYDKPSLAFMQAHIQAAQNEQASQASQLNEAWAKVPTALDAATTAQYQQEIKALLQQHNAVMVAHYYVEPELQDLALATGGMVGDSLEMARFCKEHPAQTLLVAGVRFMGETAKILSPEKTVLMPDLDATCSLDLGCPAPEFKQFCDSHPERTVVVYANTSADVKAHADWVVTSSIAIEIVEYLKQKGEKIIWGPDRHLGHYIQEKTGADMLLWQGACIVHNEFKGLELQHLKQQHPEALVLVHPESPAEVVALADVVGSTSKLLNVVKQQPTRNFIVATDQGIVHEMKKHAPQTQFYAAPTAGNGATCKSCAFCPWMAMNGLAACAHVLKHQQNQIELAPDLIEQAKQPILKMLQFAQDYQCYQRDQQQTQHLAQGFVEFKQWLAGQQHEHDRTL